VKAGKDFNITKNTALVKHQALHPITSEQPTATKECVPAFEAKLDLGGGKLGERNR